MPGIKHIVSILLLAVTTLVAAQETYVIDSVCVGAERTYRRDGEAGYTYDWFIQDKDSNTVANPIGVDVLIDTIWGNEFDYQWLDTGTFYIRVEVYSEHNCDTIELGQVKVYPDPGVAVPDDKIVCALEDIIVSGDTAWNYSVMFWETRGDGSFSNDEQLHPTYYLGFTDSTSGTVTLVLTAWGMADNETCVPAVDSVTYFFSNPEIDLQVVDVLCYGDSTAWISTTVTNGISPYDYSWTGPDGFTASTWDISGLKTGEYILTVVDANGCVDIDTAIINEPTELLLSIDSIHDVSCFGYSDGFVNSSASGGTPPYSFNLAGSSQNGSNVVFNTLSAGKYELILTDANGCVVSDSVEIKEPEELIADIDTINAVQCYNFDNGSAHVTVIGGTEPYNYEWSTLPVQTTDWVVDLAPGTYSVIITDDNGCQAFDTVTITEPDPLVLTADSIDVRCGGKKLGSIDLHVSGGTPYAAEPYYRYEWQDTTGNVFATTEDVENLAGDQLYTVWVTDSLGCVEMHQVYINEIKNVELTAIVDTALCYGDLWSIDVTATKGKKPYEFVWTDSTGVNVISNDEDLENVPAGIYIVTVYDRDSCNETMNFVLEEPEELLADLYPDDSTICETEITRIQADPDGGTGDYAHLWTGSGATYLDRKDTTVVYFGTAPPDTYQLIYTLTDENSCITGDTIEIVVNPLIVDTTYISLCANALPYVWEGVDYFTSGQYIDTLVGTIGCDTIRTLDLFIEPMEEDTIYISLCANQLPYKWFGTDYDAAGQYIDTIPGQIGVGCDTIRTLDLFIEPMEEDTIYASICSNELPYNWLGNDYLGDGLYTDTISGLSGGGCDTIRVLDLQLLPDINDTIYASICSNELPYNWNGNLYDSAGFYIDTIAGQIGIGCDTIRTLDLFILPMEEDTIYASICANELPYDWNGNLYDSAGFYIDTIAGQIGIGCDTIRTLDLFILPMEEDTIYASICANELPYDWNGNLYDSAGLYIDTIAGQIGIGCDTIRTLDLFILPMEEDTIYASICANELPYDWNGNLYDSAGLYIDTIAGQIGIGCDTIRTLDLFILPMEEDTIYASICANELPYDWNGNLYDSAGFYIDTIAGQIGIGCDTIRTLDLFILPMEEDTIYASICANELPYPWNGNLYDSAGFYIDTIPGQIGIGCDTIRTLDLFILPMEEDTIYASICANELPYDWNGNLYDSAGLYIDTIAGQIGIGCDTIRTLDLFILPMEEDTIYASICANELPYDWNGNLYDSAGLYIDTIAGQIGIGCDTIRTLDLFILPMEEDTIYASICANELPYDWNGNLYDSAGFYIDTIAGQIGIGCDTIRTLDLFILPMEEDTIYASICANELPYPWNGNLYDSAGFYIDTIPGQIGIGCDTIRTLDLFILPMEEDTIYASICANELPYDWNGNLYDSAGLYIDTIPGQIGLGCDTIRTLDLFILPMEEDTIYASICANELPYDWNGNLYDSAGLYIDTIPGQIGLGCDTIRTLDLFILPMEEDTIYASICANELPYDWNGNLYDSAGLYIDTIAGQIGIGCDTIRTLDLFILPMEEDTIYASICANELPYDWNGNLYDSAGLYIDTIAGQIGIGCDTIRTLDLFILPMEEDTIYASICANELPYDWNGNLYDSAGLYIDTIAGQIGIGCDTIRTLDLFILPMEEDTIYASICANELPYDWNGNLYDSAGLYIDTIAGQIGIGCDTIRTLDLFILPMEEDTIYASICANELPYDWNGNLYDSAGLYIDTIAGQIGIGCDTIRTLDLFILPMEEDTIYASICANELPYDWNGNLYDSAGFYIDTIAGQIGIGCDTIRTLDLFILPMEEDTIYASICANELPYPWNGNLYDSAGFYIDTIPGQIGIGCDTIRTLDLFILPMEEDTIYASICANELPYDWNGNLYDSAGLYIDTIPGQIGLGCDTIRTLDLFILPMEEDTIYVSLCANELPYDWNGNLYDSAGFYIDTIAGQIGIGCDTIRTLDLFILPMEEDTIYASICANELPYPWNGNLYDSAGFYIDTIPGQIGLGCDTIRTLDLFILPMEEDTIYASICANELPYPWNGNLYDSAGFYIDTIPGQIGLGCDTIRTLDLFILPMEEDTIYASICANELLYDWNGNLYDSAGFYIDTIPGQIGFGCDTIRTLDLFILPMEEDTIYASICANELPYDWNGNLYDSAGFYIDTIPGQIGFGCDTIRTLDLFILPMEEDTIYASICANELPYPWNGNLYDSAGFYIDTIPGQIGFGCDTIRTLDLFILPMEEDTIYASICANELPYPWNGNLYDSAGFYIDTIPGQIGLGCDTIRTLDLFIFPMEEDTIYASICANELPYPWNGNLYDSAGFYIDTIPGQIGFGCDTIRTLDLFIEPMEEVTIYASICANELPYPWNGNLYDSAGFYIDTIPGQIGFGCDTIRTLDLFILPMEEDTIYASICANELPYDWNGNLYDSAGFYIDTIPGQIGLGCDTIRTLDLFILPMEEDTIYASICANELPYDWNGNLYDSAGLYIDTIPGQIGLGCDSIIMLDLTVLPTSSDTVYAEICESSLPYDWNGTDVFTSGFHRDSLLSYGGCDSILVLSLNILPDFRDTVYAEICESSLPYDWNGTDVFTSGFHRDSLLSYGGCDSILVLSLNILPDFRDTVYAEICESSLPYDWNGTDVFTSGFHRDSLLSYGGCDSILVLSLNILPDFRDTVYAEICESSLPYDWNGTDVFTSGFHRDSLLSYGGCDSILVLSLNILPDFRDTVYAEICESSLPYDWNGTDVFTSGFHRDSLLSYGGCDSILVLSLNILPDFRDTVYAEICESSLPYDWNGTDVFTSGFHRDSLLSYGGCDSILVLSLNILPDFRDTVYAEVCESSLPYDWNGTDVFTSGFHRDSLLSYGGCDSILVLSLQTYPDFRDTVYAEICESSLPYDWNGTDIFTSGFHTDSLLSSGGCDSILVLHLTISPQIELILTPTNVLCYGDSTGAIDLLVAGGIPPFKYVWSNGVTTKELTGLPEGMYGVTVTDSIGCLASDSIYISQPDSIFLEAVSVNVNFPGASTGSIDLTVSGGTPNLSQPYYLYEWSDSTGVIGLTEDLSNLSAGVYTVEVSDANNCTATLNVTITEPDEIPELGMYCPPTLELECKDELIEYPVYANYAEYTAAGGFVTSDCGVDSSSFNFIGQISNLSTCPEIITRSYTILDSCGQLDTCVQEITINDTVPPSFLLRNKQLMSSECRFHELAAMPYANLDDLKKRGQATFSDNCGIESMELISTEENSSVCPKIYTRVYAIYDYCENKTLQTEVIEVYDYTKPIVENPDTLYSDCSRPKKYSSYEEFRDLGNGYVEDCNAFTMDHVGDKQLGPTKWERTYKFVDECNNVEFAKQIIILEETPVGNLDTILCETEPDFIWNEIPISTDIADTDKRYTAKVKRANGCDSIVNLHVTINPIVYGNEEPMLLCEGAPDTIWHGQIIEADENRTYYHTLTSAEGCDSIVTLNVIINPVVYGEDSLEVCEGDQELTWYQDTISTSRDSSYVTTLSAVTGCDSIVKLNVRVNPIVYAYEIDTVCEGSNPYIWNGQTILTDQDRIYSDTLSNANGCDSIVTLEVTVVPTKYGVEYDTICQWDPEYLWNDQTILTDQSRNYNALLARASGCDSIATLEVTVLEPEVEVIEQRYCEGDPIAPTSFGIIVPGVDSIYYRKAGNGENGCDRFLALDVRFYSPTYSYDTLYLCESSPDTTWNEHNIVIDPAYSGSTYVSTLQKANEEGCDSIASLHVIITPSVYGEEYMTLCEGADTTWNGLTISGTRDSSYSYPFENASKWGCDSIATLHVTILPTVYGSETLEVCIGADTDLWYGKTISSTVDSSYTATLESSLGCDSIATLHVTVLPTVYGADTLDVCRGVDIDTWYGQVISTTVDGSYTTTLASSQDCDSVATLYVFVLPEVQATENWQICAGSPDTVWNGQLISGEVEGTYIDTMENGSAMGCDSITLLQVEILPINVFDSSVYACGSYLWDWGDNNTYTETGIYTTTRENLNGCSDTLRLNLVVSPEFDLQETHVDQGANPNPVGTIDLDIEGGTDPISISWTGPNGFTATSEDISGLYAGNYQVQVSDTFGCYDSLLVAILSVEPELVCLPDTVIECPDPSQYPAATNLAEFMAYGGSFKPENLIANIRAFELAGNRDSCLSIDRYYVIEDIYGRLDSCTQHIDFYDLIPPVITCPTDTAIECLSDVISDITTIEEFEAVGGTLFDNCEIDPNSFTARTEKVFSLDRKTIINHFSISDLCGNIDSCVQVITLTDTIPPEAICNSITVQLDENGRYVLTDIDMVTISKGSNDNCSAEEDLIIEVDIVDFTCEDVEEGKLVNVVVTDEAGNSSVCMADITVVDNLPPTANCQDITVYLDETGIATITTDTIDNGSVDNCELEGVYISRDRFDCTDIGENLVKLYAVDIYGLRDTCEAIVTVVDQIAPYITCIGKTTIQLDDNATYALTWEMLADSVWDECGVDTVLLSDYELGCDNIGTTYIEVTAYDMYGNPATCIAEFEVFGNIAPNVVNDSAVTAVDIPVEIPVVNNDYDLKTSINISSLGVVISPSHGSVVVDNKTGIVTYTPDPGYIGPDIFRYSICDDGIPCIPMCGEAIVFITVRPANQPPVAIDDYFDVPCGNLNGNVLVDNGGGADSDPDGDQIVVNPIPIVRPNSGVVILYENGNFEYEPFEDFVGVDSFQYEIHDIGVPPSLYDSAWVYITRVADNDCDGIADADDIDDDNDGIRDVNEGDLAYDSDLDGIPDSYDVDSDNDGILDNIEGQGEHNYIPPTGRDSDGDGWDDAYDPDNGGYPFDIDLTDTDGDSMPDFLDIDSDNDGVFDFIEGHDENADGIADVVRIYNDSDFDGLDDAYDTQSGWAMPGNETASNAPLQDFDGDGERDWRDTNDEDDEYQTITEDINGNGDFSDDDLDLDGRPEYLDTDMECDLFIPEGFSPNDDGVHDFFQILCIYPRYPNAKMMIFNRNGNKLFEKENYGNFDVWGWDDAWWWGTSENKLTLGRSGGLPAGNYIYVLELNDGLGTVKNGTVMVAY